MHDEVRHRSDLQIRSEQIVDAQIRQIELAQHVQLMAQPRYPLEVDRLHSQSASISVQTQSLDALHMGRQEMASIRFESLHRLEDFLIHVYASFSRSSPTNPHGFLLVPRLIEDLIARRSDRHHALQVVVLLVVLRLQQRFLVVQRHIHQILLHLVPHCVLVQFGHVRAQKLVRRARLCVVQIRSLEDQTALSVPDLRRPVLLSGDVFGFAPNLAVVEVLNALSVQLVVHKEVLAQPQTLVVQIERPFLLSLVELALVAVLVLRIQTTLAVVLPPEVAAIVQQVSRSQVRLASHALHLSVRPNHLQHALVRLPLVVQPLVVVVVLEEQVDVVRVVVVLLQLLQVVLQQRHRLVVAVTRQIVEIVHDTRAHLGSQRVARDVLRWGRGRADRESR